MSTITKEFTKEQLIARIHQVTAINKYRISRDPDADGLAMDNELLAIALASLEAGLVSVPDDYFASLVAAARVRADKAMRKFPQPNYVLNKVAEESGEVIKAVIHFTEGREEWRNVEGEIIDNLAMLIRLVMEGDQVIGFTPPDACRAAMLQGADGNSPVIPDGWVACSERMPDSQEWVIVFAKWANQQVLCWDDVANRWTDFEDQSYFHDTFSHWMPLPAAPQQEAK